jgi:hypothetical protein
MPGALKCSFALALALCMAMLSTPELAAQQRHLADTLPPGTLVPVRFVHGIVSGRDAAGSPVMLQSMAALIRDSCVMLSPFRPVYAHLVESRGGGFFGEGGKLALETDSVRRRSGTMLPVSAVLDTLEWRGNISIDNGVAMDNRRKPTHSAELPVATAGGAVIATGGLAVVPIAIAGGVSLVWKGKAVTIEGGELAALRLTAPFIVPSVSTCRPLDGAGVRALQRILSSLPPFAARTTDESGQVPGDQINFVLLGTQSQIDSAFAAADWLPRVANTLKNEVTGATDVVLNKPSSKVAFSNAYYEGRVEDLAFERPGPTSRERHHIRLWSIDSSRTIWVGAADEDIGLKVDLTQLPTHRVSPDIDDERDILSGDLEAGGCAVFIGYVSPKGAITSGVNSWGQEIRSDGRAAVLKTGCGALNDLTR